MTITPGLHPEQNSPFPSFYLVNRSVLAKLHGLPPNQTGGKPGEVGLKPNILTYDYTAALYKSLEDMVTGKTLVRDNKIHFTSDTSGLLSEGYESLSFGDLLRAQNSPQAIAIIAQEFTGQNVLPDQLDSNTLMNTIAGWKTGKTPLPPGATLSENKNAVFFETKMPGVFLRFTSAGDHGHSLNIMYDVNFVNDVTGNVAHFPERQRKSAPQVIIKDYFDLDKPLFDLPSSTPLRR